MQQQVICVNIFIYIVYLLILLEGIPKRVQAFWLVRVDLSQRGRHHFEVLLIISHLSHRDTVQIV